MALLTLKEAARELALKSKQSILNLAARGELKLVDISVTGSKKRRFGVQPSEIRRFIERRGGARETPTPPRANEPATSPPVNRSRRQRGRPIVAPALRPGDQKSSVMGIQ